MNQIVFFYSGSEPLIRIVVVGSLAYFSLVLLLRISGKRSLAQLNAFDFVVTVAIGSTLGRLITAKGTSLAEGITAFLTLLLLQYLVSWFTVRSSTFEDLVTADPSLLYFRGQFLPTAMRAQRVTQSQLLAVVRQHQVVSLSAVEAIVMESAGTIAIIPKAADGTPANAAVLDNVRGVS